MMYLTFLFIAWCVYVSIEGFREGMYFHYLFKSNGSATYEHKLWTVQRIIVFLIIFIFISVAYCNIEKSLLYACSIVLCSPFLHDGFYYVSRHKLDERIYKKGFFDQSTTSTALLTKFCTPILRSIYFLISLIIFCIFVL